MIKIKNIPYCNLSLLKNINNYYLGKTKIIKTWSRASIILPRFIGLIIYVHNGKTHIPVKINEQMIGHKLGEFSITRTKPIHQKNKNENKKYKIQKHKNVT